MRIFISDYCKLCTMAELKKYTSFEALKLDEKSTSNDRLRNNSFSEFQAFLKKLRSEYSNKKKIKTDGRRLN